MMGWWSRKKEETSTEVGELGRPNSHACGEKKGQQKGPSPGDDMVDGASGVRER